MNNAQNGYRSVDNTGKIKKKLIFFSFQVMGGQGSDMFEYFKILILQGLVAARKHSDKITTLVDVMRAGTLTFQVF